MAVVAAVALLAAPALASAATYPVGYNALDPEHPGAVPCTLVLPLIGAPAYAGPSR